MLQPDFLHVIYKTYFILFYFVPILYQSGLREKVGKVELADMIKNRRTKVQCSLYIVRDG